VVYYNLAASADCYPSKVPLGSYSSVTIAYPPDAIRTLQTCSLNGGYKPVNYTQLYYPQANSIAAPGCSLAFGDPVDPAASNIQSNPIFSQPNEINSFDSRWLPCSKMYTPQFGIYDPPYALSKVTGQLVTSGQPLPTNPPATPGQGGSPAAPRPTGPMILHSVPQDPSPVKPPLPTTLPDKPAPTVIGTPPTADPGASSKDKPPGDPKPIATPAQSPGADNPRPTPSPKGGQDPPIIAQPITVGTQTVQQAPNGGIIAGTTTMAPGAQGTIGGVPVKVSSGFVVVGANTIALPVSPAPPLPTVAGNPIVTAPGGGVVVGGNTITAGGAAATVGGTVVSVLPSSGGLFVGGSTVALPVAPQPPLPTLGGQQIQTGPNSAIIIGGTTVTPGSAPITLGGTTFSVPVSGGGIVVNGNTMTIPPTPAATPPTVGGQQVQAGSNGAIVVGTDVIIAGGPAATIFGTVISALPGGSSVIVNGKTIPLAVAPAPTPPTVAGQTVQAGPNGAVIVGGTTITAGGPAATLSGTVVSVLPGGSSVIVNGKTIPLAVAPAPTPPTVAGQTVQAGPNGAVIVGGTTITAGGPAATLSGTVVSVLPGGSSIIMNGNTVPLAVAPAPTPPIVAGQTVQTGPNGAVIIGGTTITAGGPPVTISGIIISVLPSGGGLVIGASSTIVFPGAIPSAVNIGTDVLTYGAPAKTISGMLVSLGASGLEIGSTFVPITTGEVGNLGGIIYSAFGGGLGASPTGGKSNSTALATSTATPGGTSSGDIPTPTGSATTSGPASAKTSTTGNAGRTKDDVWLGMHALVLLAALWTVAMT